MTRKETKSGTKRRKVKPMKIAALVVSAIQDLRETKGSTPKKITGYISYASRMPEQHLKRQVSGSKILFSNKISIFVPIAGITSQFLVCIMCCLRINVMFDRPNILYNP